MKPTLTKEFLLDLVERVFWTALQAALAFLLVVVADWEFEWVPVLTAGLSVLKGMVARHTGNPNSAALSKYR